MARSRDLLDPWLERGILGLVLGILVLGPLALGAVMPLPFLLIQGMTCLVLGLWAVRVWFNRTYRLLWPPVCWAVLAFTLYAVIRYVTCDIEYLGRLELIRVLIYTSLFLAIVNNLYSRESTQAITFTLVFLGMGIAAYAVYQFLSGSEWIWYFEKGYKNRASGTFFSPNHLAGFLEMVLPLGLAYALTSRAKPVMRILLGYAGLMILAGIAVSLSRGGWLAAACAIAVLLGVLVFKRGYTLPVLATLALLLIGGLILAPKSYTLKLRAQALLQADSATEASRFHIWQQAWRMWQDHPWLGMGPDHFNTRFRQYRPPQVQLQPDKVHNDYLNTLADWGGVGFGLAAAVWVLLGVGLAQTARVVRATPNDLDPRKGSDKFALLLGASAGLAAILVHSGFDFNMHIPANAILAATLMALLSTHLRFASERFWLKTGLVGKGTVILGLLAAIMGLALPGWRYAHEMAWLHRAQKASGLERAEELKKAFAAEPGNGSTAYEIGEIYRKISLEGAEDYEDQAREAMTWFEHAMALNVWDGYPALRYGQCLDWLDRAAESGKYFDRADLLDPNGYYTQANIGLHYISLRDYAAARPWFERSLALEWSGNDIAANYLGIVNANLLAAATNQLRGTLAAPALPPAPAPASR